MGLLVENNKSQTVTILLSVVQWSDFMVCGKPWMCENVRMGLEEETDDDKNDDDAEEEEKV